MPWPKGKPSPHTTISDDDFIQLFESIGPSAMEEKTGIDHRRLMERRRNIEERIGRAVIAPGRKMRGEFGAAMAPGSLTTKLYDGIALVGSDAHRWPGRVSTAHKAFVHFTKTLKPKIIVLNGDEIDGATVSRHPPIGWEKRPSLVEEIETAKAQHDEIVLAHPKAERYWPLGNHDARFETRLATVAPEYRKIHGVHLHDHFPDFQPCWMVVINDDVVVKHRQKGGIHATHNNTLWSGKTIVTGHLHSLKVTPFTDYNGTRFGVDCGTLADPYGPQFADYTELNPVNWRSGFVVLTFCEGRLMWPEVVAKVGGGKVEFRGEIIEV